MNKQAQKFLQHFMAKYGSEIINDSKALEALLTKHASGHYQNEICHYTQAAKEGIVHALLNNSTLPLETLCTRLCMQLYDNCGMDLKTAGWTVESWVIALKFQGQADPRAGFTIPDWAKTLSKDSFGLYIDLDIHGIKQRCRWLPAGTFLMGSPESEINHYEDETQHAVTLSQGFWLADTTCTQALWKIVMGNNPSDFRSYVTNPVEQVSWNGIQEFFELLNKTLPGLNARLPTGAQWEYACRAGTTTPFSFGENITTAQVNYDGSKPYANAKKEQFRKQTVPVKSLPPNPWGFYEMHGNVWEWCQEWYGQYPYEAVTDPVGPSRGVTKILRGGSWFRGARGVRSANRSGDVPDAHNFQIGFRFVIG